MQLSTGSAEWAKPPQLTCCRIFCSHLRPKPSSAPGSNLLWGNHLSPDLGITVPGGWCCQRKKRSNPFTVNDVNDTLRRDEDRKLIFITDEFDRTQDPDIDTMFADTIKALSDFNVDTTLIASRGRRRCSHDLIEEHQSVDRMLGSGASSQNADGRTYGDRQVRLISAAGMEVTDDAVSQICTISLGLPHYAHAIGTGLRESCNRMIKNLP